MIGDVMIPCGGARLCASMGGKGPGIVMLHAGVADRRMWGDAVLNFVMRYAVAAYDRRGFGETHAPDEPFRHIDDLDAVIGHLGADRPILIGCSQGGRIAIDYALHFPARVGGLVLVAPAVSGAPDPDSYPAAIAALLARLEAAEAEGDHDGINHIEAHLWLDGPLCPEGRAGGAVRRLFFDMNGVALRHPELTRQIACPPAFDRLGDIAVPTLLVCGDLDFPHIQDRSRRVASVIPSARFELMAGCAHLPNLEQPAAFNRLVEAFISGL